jgi:hypothetical protein
MIMKTNNYLKLQSVFQKIFVFGLKLIFIFKKMECIIADAFPLQKVYGYD